MDTETNHDDAINVKRNCFYKAWRNGTGKTKRVEKSKMIEELIRESDVEKRGGRKMKDIKKEEKVVLIMVW